MESVQPLIDIYFPEKGAIQKFPDGLQEVNKDDEVAGLLQKGENDNGAARVMHT